MRTSFITLLLLAFVPGMLRGLDAPPRAPRTEVSSSPRILLSSTDLQSVRIALLETLDLSPVYEITVALPEGQTFSPGTLVDYEIRGMDGTALGGGMFLAAPKMIGPLGNTLTAHTGFSGLKLDPRQVVFFKLLGAGYPAPRRTAESPQPEKQVITDTCTTYCDLCGDKAALLCSHGVSTFSCSCSDSSRMCSFSCQSGGPPV